MSVTAELPPRGRGHDAALPDELRASHEDRDRVAELLRGAAGDGRLTAEELDQRFEQALTARTLGELAAWPAPAGCAAEGCHPDRPPGRPDQAGWPLGGARPD
jgi:hypothetical protein